MPARTAAGESSLTPRRTVPVVIALAGTSLLAMVTSNTLLSDWVERHPSRQPNPVSLDSGPLGPVEAAPSQDWPTWGGHPAAGGSTPAAGATPPPPAMTQPPSAGPETSIGATRHHPTRKFRYVMVEQERVIILPPLPPKPPATPPKPAPKPPRPPQHHRHCDGPRHQRQPHAATPSGGG